MERGWELNAGLIMLGFAIGIITGWSICYYGI